VLGDEKLIANRRVHTELFGELACEAGVVRLAWLAFAAGKLPEASQMSTLEAAGDEQMPVAFDDRGDDDQRWRRSADAHLVDRFFRRGTLANG